MADPDLDGRRREAIREHIERIAPHYVDDWDPEEEDVGTALVAHFAEMAEDVTERLDEAPAKHRVAFFDELGFDRRPPQAASVPVQFTIAPEAGENVAIEAGTEVVAEERDERPEQTFRFDADAAFEATPAQLRSVYSVDPASDGLFDHDAVIDGGEGATALFGGEDEQENLLYLGHSGLLTVAEGSTIRVVVETSASPAVIKERLQWEYYGEKPTGDGDVEEGWHVIAGPGTADGPGDVIPPDITPTFDPDDLIPLQQRSMSTTKRLFKEVTGESSGTPDDDLATKTQLFNPNIPNEEIQGPIAEPVFPEFPTFPEIPLPGGGPGSGSNTVTVELGPEGALVATEVDGRESKWIRCRVPDEKTPTGPLDVQLESVSLAAAPSNLGPDMLLANDVPQDPGEGSIKPFGDTPTHRDTFYLNCEEAFTKADAEVTITFETEPEYVAMPMPDTMPLLPEVDPLPGGNYTLTPVYEGDPAANADDATDEPSTDGGPDPGEPDVSWEYWNGNGWAKLSVDDATDNFNHDQPADFDEGEAATVTFRAPEDVAPTSVAGHDGVWVRARLVGGNYGDRVYVERGWPEDKWVPQHESNPPTYHDVSISYEYPEGHDPEHLVPYNANAFGPDRADHDGGFRPFSTLADADQALYLGFDRPLSDGPLQLFVDVEEHEYPEGFASRVRWEYCVDPATDEWAALDTTDGTGGFTERGIVGLVLPEETTAFDRFGEHYHWIRARVRGESFGGTGLDLAGDFDPDIFTLYAQPAERRDCGDVVRTEPPAGEPTNVRPRLAGLHPNTGRAANVTVVEGAALGSSDGSPEQTFGVDRPPVLDGEVWVDELTALSAKQREELAAERPNDVEVERDRDGDVRAVWVRWTEVDTVLDSGSSERHYVLDRTDGAVTFGDGTSGAIPPRGRDNVRMTYRTGGGVEGNVGVGAVTGTKSSVPYVDAVTNPAPGAGGANAEATEAVLDRAPQTIRDRGRAVTPADFERIAGDASRRLARVRCIEGMNRAGDAEPGWVTLLVVPDDQRAKPVPSVGLKSAVEEAVAARAPATLSARDRIVVRGPSYVGVGTDVTVVGADVASVSALEERIDSELRAFCHPLSGGPEGDSWPFGELPDISTLFALLEGIDGVDHVSSLSVSFDGGHNVVTVTEGEATPSVAADALVHSDGHDVTVRLAERTNRQGGAE